MVHASLFSGIGGPEVAAAMLGWDNAFHCEINPFGKAILDYWFPDSVSYEDIIKTDFSKWRGRIDVLTGGFPCQPFSYAGKRGGQNDERYLWPQMLRAIDEIRPTWVVGENVAGIVTMVEGGVLTDLGGEASLFQEGDDIHRFALEQSFTIERICRDLERAGYSVQPVLIPAAAVGAPHRRDRIFIIANVADADSGDDLRDSREHEGTCREEWLQERDEVRKPGESDTIRSEIQGVVKNTLHGGQLHGQYEEQGDQRNKWNAGAGSGERLCDKTQRLDASDANCQGREKSQQPGRGEDSAENRARLDNSAERFSRNVSASDSDLQRRNECLDTDLSSEEERQYCKADSRRFDTVGLDSGRRWRNFPTVSPIHRGNDGLPFSLDDLTIPASRWRNESLKAYGNAIVPQVMYEIFRAIEEVS